MSVITRGESGAFEWVLVDDCPPGRCGHCRARHFARAFQVEDGETYCSETCIRAVYGDPPDRYDDWPGSSWNWCNADID